jgi:hypothetical protein
VWSKLTGSQEGQTSSQQLPKEEQDIREDGGDVYNSENSPLSKSEVKTGSKSIVRNSFSRTLEINQRLAATGQCLGRESS